MIYNIEKDDYEPIAVEQYRRLKNTNYFIYKNQMYDNYRSYPVETELDVQKLHAICLHGWATEFYTDGTFLVGGYRLSKFETEQRGKQTWYIFEKPLFRDVDWESLQIMTEKIMVDKNHIYQVKDGWLQVTPIKDLGLDVKIIPLETQQPPPQDTTDSLFGRILYSVPEYIGGDNACLKFIEDNIVYPQAAREAKIEGRVAVSFTVERDGSLTNFEILRSVHPDLDKEALRVAKLMPGWKPAIRYDSGETVRGRVTVPVRFRIEE